jgi:mRNA interferase MazF
MVINQGDIFWIEFSAPNGSEPGYRHPHQVIQNNLFNRSRINTVVVRALMSNMKRTNTPGNVALKKGEADLPKKSVVSASQLFTVNKSDLFEKIGTLSMIVSCRFFKGLNFSLNPEKSIKETG